MVAGSAGRHLRLSSIYPRPWRDGHHQGHDCVVRPAFVANTGGMPRPGNGKRWCIKVTDCYPASPPPPYTTPTTGRV
ncbi:hypothetical protein Pmani_019694 [Petrolisthes manimaculis]|uniref:Uncharacterized protein n=1 Tax=Petrolisthes manimaculis TaxID=1843537 RepID=A0AAE1U735_9EUCA|nr:hypothetical protein Pmani_019694 [Petrolisthes manimaculis]